MLTLDTMKGPTDRWTDRGQTTSIPQPELLCNPIKNEHSIADIIYMSLQVQTDCKEC